MTDGIRIFARIVSRLVRILPLFISTLLLMSTLYDTSITRYRTMGNGHIRQFLSNRNLHNIPTCIIRLHNERMHLIRVDYLHE